jgi:hypothetical protein
MKSSSPKSAPEKDNQPHESGALAGWGLVLGALIGLGVGLFLGYALILGFMLGAVGWVGGAVVERSRR